MNRAFKSLTFALAILIYACHCTQAQEYVLDFSKTQSFKGSCAGIAADQLVVANDSCGIVTQSVFISDAKKDHQKMVLVSVKINKEGKLGKSDKAWVKLLVNGKTNKSFFISGDGITENYKRQDKIILTESSSVAVQVMLKSTSKAKAWIVKSGDIEISTTDYADAKDVSIFNGIFNGKVVKLNWSTQSEINTNYFAVERSKDGATFEKAALIKGAGTTDDKSQYAFVDHNLFSGNTYYRLKQIGFSGKESQLGEVINISTAPSTSEAATDFTKR